MASDVRLFVSYRSAQPHVGWFAAQLRASEDVTEVSTFKTSFVKGKPFPQQIRDHIERSDVVLAVIGPTWAIGGIETEDWVRSELAYAQERGIPVLPVLFDAATMPSRTGLPGIEWLSTLNAVKVRTDDDDFFARDVENVVRAARKLRRRVDRGWLVAAGSALLLVAVLVVGLVLLRGGGGSDDDDGSDTTVESTVPGGSDRLLAGDRLASGEAIRTSDGRHVLEMTPPGVLVASTDGAEFWRSDGTPVAGALAFMQEDGNLVIYPSEVQTSADDQLWNSGTCCHANAHVEVGDDGGDGFVAIYADGQELFRKPDSVVVTVPPTDPTASTLEPVEIPMVAGRTEAEARDVLEGELYRFAVEIVAETSSTVDAGIVIRTEPDEGTAVEPGSAVRLVVSSGVGQVTVPDVVGETEAAARDALRELRVAVTYQDLPVGDSDDGRVLAQSPRAGTEVIAGSAIRLTVGRAAVIN